MSGEPSPTVAASAPAVLTPEAGAVGDGPARPAPSTENTPGSPTPGPATPGGPPSGDPGSPGPGADSHGSHAPGSPAPGSPAPGSPSPAPGAGGAGPAPADLGARGSGVPGPTPGLPGGGGSPRGGRFNRCFNLLHPLNLAVLVLLIAVMISARAYRCIDLIAECQMKPSCCAEAGSKPRFLPSLDPGVLTPGATVSVCLALQRFFLYKEAQLWYTIERK